MKKGTDQIGSFFFYPLSVNTALPPLSPTAPHKRPTFAFSAFGGIVCRRYNKTPYSAILMAVCAALFVFVVREFSDAEKSSPNIMLLTAIKRFIAASGDIFIRLKDTEPKTKHNQ